MKFKYRKFLGEGEGMTRRLPKFATSSFTGLGWSVVRQGLPTRIYKSIFRYFLVEVTVNVNIM